MLEVSSNSPGKQAECGLQISNSDSGRNHHSENFTSTNPEGCRGSDSASATYRVTLGQLLNLSVPQLPHLIALL